MKFIPKYTVSYKGMFHVSGIAFEIDDADRTEMEKHGRVIPAPQSGTPPDTQMPPDNPQPKRGGRQKKVTA